MGILNFLRFTPLLIDFLAWPVFALGYPLCASIRAIESGSKYHMRKLVIYWTLFSLISLFELAFIKLIEWIPLWSSIKFIAICWLVIPRFDGACYVYQSLVNPCSSMNVRNLVSRLCKPNEDQRLMTETLVAVTERYIKENGSEAFENLMKSKISNMLHCKEADNVQKVTQQPELIYKIDAATIQQPKCKERAVAEKDINALEPPEKIASTSTEKQRPDAKILPEAAVKKVQREWACALCQVTTTSEKTLNSHLQGSKHKSKWDELRRSKQDTKRDQKMQEQTTPNLWCNICKLKLDREIDLATHLRGRKHSSKLKCKELDNVQKDILPPESIDKIDAATIQQPKCKEPEVAEKDINASEPAEKIASTTEEQRADAKNISEKILRKEASEDRLPEAAVKKVEREWACALCGVTTTSEKTLNSHLQGSKHKSKCEKLKRSEQDTKSRGSSPFVSNKSGPGDHEPEKGNIGEGSKQNYAKSDLKQGRIHFIASIDGQCWICRK